MRKRIETKHSESLIGYLFMLPSVIGFTVFVFYPLIYTCIVSLTKWNGLETPQFIGIDNFIYMFTKDPTFLKSIKATFLYVLYTVPTGLVLGFLFALLLNNKLRGLKIFRTIFYIPVVIPAIAVLALWKFIYSPDYGLANSLLRILHLPTSKWLESEVMALPSIAIVTLWGVGSTMIIFLSGLQSIPEELYEAADVDGVNGFQKLWHITLPVMSPVLFLQLITGIIIAFQAFNPPQVLTNYAGKGGGPAFATYLLSFSIYDNAFNSQSFGYAMSQVIILFLIILVLTTLVYKFSDRFVYYESE